ncbi:hypothetical protein [Wenxinia saemankumensis]|uniref:Uncharacterized protein n=1 Tax=Wenxinia saemankumensis TaxID=1447782 RepID=A0A1M6BYH8_9RHOB|nr:hypothetical protein [Wenxinia saemankumensis]SHI53839.1 hypothetical protein SAMN05444417_0915 [Wenxinia saemankumensis]
MRPILTIALLLIATSALAGFFGTPTGGWGVDAPPPRLHGPSLP